MKRDKKSKKSELFPKTRKRFNTAKNIKKAFTILISIINVLIVVYNIYSNFTSSKQDN